MTGFSAQVFQNDYLPSGADTVDAVITVNAVGDGPSSSATSGHLVEVIVIDVSGSMLDDGGAKIAAAKVATKAAIDTLPDEVEFAIVAGTHEARLLYPRRGLATANLSTRREAKQMVDRVKADGGTAIGTWLLAAQHLFEQRPGAIRHAILLTDGKNQHEEPHILDRAIARCIDSFQCDARGLGTDWEVHELRRIASALLGTVDIIPRPSEMEAEFTRLTESAMGKRVGDVALRLWSPRGAEVEFIKQVAPSIEDLTPRARAVRDLTTDYPLGAWGDDESRDYHLRVKLPPGNVGDERLAARVMLSVDDEEQPVALVRAIWTDDNALSTRINREVAHYTGQAELADAIHEGLAARQAGDAQQATLKLGKAVQIAHAAGNGDTVRLLSKVVDVEDPATGTVRLKRQVTAEDEMTLDVRSTRTVRVNK